MREVLTSRGLYALVDDDDYDRVVQYKWWVLPRAHTTYVARKVSGTTQYLHCFIMGQVGIDHRNGNGLDNQRSNLRVATSTQNRRNTHRHVTFSSQYKGVTFNKQEQKFKAYIYVNYKSKHLGYFSDEVSAARAYDKAARELFGEFAHLNLRVE